MAKDFQGEYGDRRQEIVIIGINMNQAAIIERLDECLLTDEEMALYAKLPQDTGEDPPDVKI